LSRSADVVAGAARARIAQRTRAATALITSSQLSVPTTSKRTTATRSMRAPIPVARVATAATYNPARRPPGVARYGFAPSMKASTERGW
jgi:flagellar capping protein FliD